MAYRTGPDSLRLVREKVANTSNAISRDSENISVKSDLLLPYYAVPGAGSAYNLVLRNRTGTGKTPYEFRNLKDLLALQRAVTGYEVASDIEGVTLTLHRTWHHAMTGYGRVQMWRWQPLQSMKREEALMRHRRRESSIRSEERSGIFSFSEETRSTNSTFANVTRGLHPSIVENSFVSMSNEEEGHKPVIAATSPHVPVIVIFTKIDDAYTYIVIDRKSPNLLTKRFLATLLIY